MPRFFTGDELGTVKSIRYSQGENLKEWKADSFVLAEGGADGKTRAVQKLSVCSTESGSLLATARKDGTASVIRISDDAGPSVVHEWKETRLKEGQRYVGLAVRERHAISCTSNGALRLVHLGAEENAPSTQTGVLPMRLCDWRLSHSGETFAYGGDEVELSVWNTEAAFTRLPAGDSGSESKKRKRDQLLPGEVWRSKNLPNDGLGLRRPVHITALIYLQPSSSISHHHLLAGTQEGHIRRYDTRAARRPVANWERIGKMGGISTAEKGLHEHEVFVGDHGYNLMALDLRNGRVIYGYKGLSGAVSSIAPSPELLASACQDRFLRLHSTFPPPAVEGQQQEHKGEVVDKLYMKVIPAAVVWDGISDSMRVADAAADSDDEEGAEDGVWDAMDDAEDDDDESVHRKKVQKSRVHGQATLSNRG